MDIGAEEIVVAVPPDRAAQPVRAFRTFTPDLHALAAWLEACGIDTVAMESTGVYWIPIFELLEARGLVPYLVNARHPRSSPDARAIGTMPSGSRSSMPSRCCRPFGYMLATLATCWLHRMRGLYGVTTSYPLRRRRAPRSAAAGRVDTAG